MRIFGLIGYPLTHSFSRKYFADKFLKENIRDAEYENFPIADIRDFKILWDSHIHLLGLNVTIPYKQQVIACLDVLSEDAKAIQAVNTVKRQADGRLKGYNTDIPGFQGTLESFIPPDVPLSALVLGTGGASKAVRYVLELKHIPYKLVSRHLMPDQYRYEDISETVMAEHRLIINTTPLGMYPGIDKAPPIPYTHLTDRHFLLDLIYNPAETRFLSEGKARGSQVKNGLEMLILQAEKSWEIWNNPHL